MERLRKLRVEQIEEILQGSGQTFWAITVDGIVIDVLGALGDGLGYAAEDLRGTSLLEIIEREHRGDAIRQFQMVVDGTVPEDDGFEIELRAADREGGGHEVKVDAATIQLEGYDEPVVFGLSTDITRQKVAERALERERELFFEAFESAPNGMVLLHLDPVRGGLIKGANTIAAEITGYSREEVIGMWLTESGIVTIDDDKLAIALDDSSALLTGEKTVFSLEREIFRKDGSALRMKADVSALDLGVKGSHDDPFPINAVAHIEDVTEQRETEVEMRYQARHDALTDLFNRRWFLSLLSDRLDRSVRGHGGGALLMFDLDDFKQVNDSHGHHVGDDVLRQVADVFKSALRSSDLVARLGGDEFAALLPKTSVEGANRVARSLLKSLSDTEVEIDDSGGETFRPRLSIGVLMLDGRDIDAGQALRECDEAMYEAKRQGGSRFVVSGAEDPPDRP